MTSSPLFAPLLATAAVIAVATLVRRSGLDRGRLRSQKLRAVAGDVGWSFSADDVFEYGAMPFALFEGTTGRAANVMVGETHDGRPVCLFDYRGRIGQRAPIELYSCAMTDMGAGTGIDGPRVVVQPGPIIDRRPPRLGPLDTTIDRVHLDDGSPAMWSTDPALALDLIDDDLQDWLCAHWPDAQFELSGSLLLVWAPALPPRQAATLVNTSDALRLRLADGHRADMGADPTD